MSMEGFDIDGFDTPSSAAPTLDFPAAAPSSEVKTPVGGSTLEVSSSPSSASTPVVAAGPTPLTQWQERRAQLLAERRAKAANDKAAAVAKAQEELGKFNATREDRIAKTKELNRVDEVNYRKDMEALMAHGARWEKVNKLVNLAPKPGEKAGGQKRERFRKLLLVLKNQKDPDEGKERKE